MKDFSLFDSLISPSYLPEEYPACHNQAEAWALTRPLEGLLVLDATPVYRNTLVKYRALIAAGARLTVGLSPIMAHDKKIVRILVELGIPVVDATGEKQTFDLILDCAASFSTWEARLGYAELTRSGEKEYAQVRKPVFMADSSLIKRIETVLGTGESYFRSMAQLGFSEWKGKRIVVFGSGKVGSGLIWYAALKGAVVTVVTDPQTVSKGLRHSITLLIDQHDREAISKAVTLADAVVSATGVKDALAESCAPEVFIHSHALLANMGVHDEFGTEVPKERVLRNKATLNFMLDEPTHLKYIDATFALHNAGAVYLCQKGLSAGLITPPQELEEEILSVTRERGCITAELELMV